MATIVIFGGPDPEEAAARIMVREHGFLTATATYNGEMVHAGSAYRANGYIPDCKDVIPNDVIIFECARAAAGNLEIIKICDHHYPGDPGYDLGAHDYWKASSIGQLAIHIGVTPTEHLYMVAAGDHCPAAAYAGECPGIDISRFADFRITQKEKFYVDHPTVPNKTAQQICRDMEYAIQILKSAPCKDGIVDLRNYPFIPELSEAAMSTGYAYMITTIERDRYGNATGNTKMFLGGCATPDMVNTFMTQSKNIPNKLSIYGNPMRGYAGVVLAGS